MRVVHVIPGLGGSGGAERSLAADAERLAEHGVELHLAVLSDRLGLAPHLERAGATVHRIGATGHLDRARAVLALVDDLGPDVVQATLFEAQVAVQLAIGWRRRTGRPSPPALVTWANTTFSEERRFEGRARWRRIRALRLVEMALDRWSRSHYQAVTPGVAAANGPALRVPATRIHVAERGRPAARPAGDRVTTRARLGIADTDSMLLCVARHEPQKALHRAVAATAELTRRGRRVRLVVAGRDGSETARLQRLADALDPGVVQLLGARDDVDDLLSAADVVLSTSRYEGAAGAVLEAMAAGRPLVSTRVAGLDGILVDAVNCRLLDRPDDAAHVADVVAEVIDRPDASARRATAGRELYLERFTDAASSARLARLYALVAASGAEARSNA